MPIQSTWTPIVTVVADGTSTGYQFNSIPQIYSDLIIVQNLRSSRAATTEQFWIRPNNDTGANYAYNYMQGDGASATSARLNSQTVCNRIFIPAASATANLFGYSHVRLYSYTNTTQFKTISTRWTCDLLGSGTTGFAVGTWKSTSAVTSINVATENGSNIIAGSTYTIYGIVAS